MMKNRLLFTILLFLAVSSFAQDIQNRYLFIEGMADRVEHLEFFKTSFAMEANSSGYIVTRSKGEAAHTLKFNVVFDEEVFQYIITVALHRNDSDSTRLVTFDFAFNSLDEMHPFVRTLFLNAVISIPLPLLTEENLKLAQGNNWNKWIYLRASFDLPIIFYLLHDIGTLKGGIGLYQPNPEDPSGTPLAVSPIGHEIKPMPGATLGAEFHLFNFLSLELNFQLSVGGFRPEDQYFVHTGIGAEVKVPIKFHNIMLVPYGAFSYALNASPVFSEFPPFAAGPGIQLCARAGKKGILFMDVQYMFSFTDAVMHNPYLAFAKEEQLYPEPAVIHYKRSQLGIGIGYKFGILDRKQNTESSTDSLRR
jgi:hypothetical protein